MRGMTSLKLKINTSFSINYEFNVNLMLRNCKFLLSLPYNCLIKYKLP